MGRFLYFLLILFLVRMLWNAVAAMIAGQEQRRVGGNDRRAGNNTIHRGQMVRDPVCGLHLPESRALTETRSGELYHFCSERCRQRFREAS